MMKLALILLIIIIITSCNSEFKFIASDESMEKTISIGATVTYKKTTEIKRDDIVVFFLPNSSNLKCLRVIGFSGDKIEIIKGTILVNNKEYKGVESSTMTYTVYSKHATDFSNLKQFRFRYYSENYGIVSVTNKQLQEIISKQLVDSIYKLGFDSSYVYPGIVKAKSSKYFNHYYFGPINIPKKGDSINKEDRMLVEGFLQKFDEHVIRDEFYFCIGDSFSDAQDSRILGLIPKGEIIGKVVNIANVRGITVNLQ